MRKLAAVIVLVTGCATAHAAGPTPAEFNNLLAAQCEDHSARAKNVRCKGFEEEPTEFACRYDLPEANGSWKRHDAVVAIDGANWIWIDGETRCAVSAISNLN